MKSFNLFVVLSALVFCGCDNLNLGKDSGQKPVIDRIYATRATILVGETSTIYVEARDLNEESLDYVWTRPDGGEFVSPNGLDSIQWQAPTSPGLYTIRCKVVNESTESTTKELDIQVTNVSTPIVQILSPLNGDFIASSLGTINVHAKVANVVSASVDSMKCFIDEVPIDTVKNNGDFSFPWSVTGLNGPKTIRVQAWTHVLTGSTTTGEVSITVSIEGTVGKRKH